ncbi:MAG TPA: DUF4286 family protein [Gammaproteobacteria bacterium]|nr:DUF4286 family protein [Gammaproteobacteria bacterium]
MPGSAVIYYEVTLDADADISTEFDVWLAMHVHDMLQLPGFLDAKILRPNTPSVDSNTTIRRVVRYKLASHIDLERYIQEHAARMRAEAVARFGQSLRASRRVLDTHGHELADINISGTTIATNEAIILQCLNCGAPLTGKFCANCGQQNHTYAAPLWAVFNDFFGNHFGFDTKFFHSILPLLFRPGFLSSEYSAGRRVRYINPLRLYIFSSIVLFFIAWSVASPQIARFNNANCIGEQNCHATSKLFTPDQQKKNINPSVANKLKQPVLDNSQAKPVDAANAPVQTESVSGTMFGKKFEMSKTEFINRLIHDFEVYLPKMMFVFLPLVALLLKLFYIRSKRYYMEHLIFTLHNHAFIYTAMICILLAGMLGTHFSWLATPTRYFNDVVGWYMVVYIFLAMLFYYRQSFIKTLVKFLLLGFIYWLALLTTFILGIVLILTEVLAV